MVQCIILLALQFKIIISAIVYDLEQSEDEISNKRKEKC